MEKWKNRNNLYNLYNISKRVTYIFTSNIPYSKHKFPLQLCNIEHVLFIPFRVYIVQSKMYYLLKGDKCEIVYNNSDDIR